MGLGSRCVCRRGSTNDRRSRLPGRQQRPQRSVRSLALPIRSATSIPSLLSGRYGTARRSAMHWRHWRLAASHNPPQNAQVPDAPFDRTGPLTQELLELTTRITARAEEDPFGNPVLLVALAISRRIEAGALDDAAIGAVIGHLRDAAFADRARRIAAYVGGTDVAVHAAVLKDLAQRLLRPDPNDSPVRWAEYRALVERTRFAAVFTAHPTFALPAPIAHTLAETASGRASPVAGSHRPPPITLADEFAQATAAIAHGRDAIDQ